MSSRTDEQIVWMLTGKMEFRIGSEQQVCGPGDVVVIPGITEHEAWFREDTEVIDFFAPPRDRCRRRAARKTAAIRWNVASGLRLDACGGIVRRRLL
jgi:hypothetical protein